MLLKIETEIIGNFLIRENLKVVHHPYTIEVKFSVNSGQYLISITRRVTNYYDCIPQVELIGNEISKIVFPSNDFFDDQINILKYLESFGAVDMEISSINWKNCSIEWINEYDDEDVVPIRRYKRRLSYKNEKIKLLTKDWLWNTIIHRKQLEDLSLPFSFFREGSNQFYSFQYQNAFINFYLMLEGFFGNSMYKNSEVKKEFKNSAILRYGIEKSLETVLSQNSKHYLWINEALKRFHKKFDFDGIVHLIVEYRGKFSHFSVGKDNMRNPFNDREFESLAYLMMTICVFCSIKLRLEPFR